MTSAPPPLSARRQASALLTWFNANARPLPWRHTLEPYAIWVSEIMLQQTQVKTVIAYWERWLQQLPTIRALAAAEPDHVLKLWEGLGYYTRARHLQAAARQIVQEHNGFFPTQFEDILRLPGIGRYTAGAIASIAFNQPRAILDGNVIRVLTRLHGIRDHARERATTERLWGLAQALVHAADAEERNTNRRSHLRQPERANKGISESPVRSHHEPLTRETGFVSGVRKSSSSSSSSSSSNSKRQTPNAKRQTEVRLSVPGPEQRSTAQPKHRTASMTDLTFAGACSQLNQALMELGATLCTPRQPDCPRCPLRRWCVAHDTEQTSTLPNLGQRPASTSRRFVAFVLEHRNRWLVRRRPAGCVNAGLWEFPNTELSDTEPATSTAGSLSRLATRVTGTKVRELQPLLTVRHSITRYRIQLEAFHGLGTVRADAAASTSTQDCWLPLVKLEKLAFTSAHRKVLRHLRRSDA